MRMLILCTFLMGGNYFDYCEEILKRVKKNNLEEKAKFQMIDYKDLVYKKYHKIYYSEIFRNWSGFGGDVLIE